ncbi:MAG: LysM peptidoglycan-binding domain-containing protein [Chlorobi bacterium]|nr:LysM peptidoglycan-binding domain-containing protein [Chlorobiota bacterium]
MQFGKILRIFLLLFVTTFCLHVVSLAQGNAITSVKSNNKVIIDGIKYYIHIVKKGETKYSISNTYNVSQELLEKNNPEIINGLKENSALKIPIVENNPTEALNTIHIVKPSETVYSIAKSYHISINSIYELNPGSDKKIMPGQKLIIRKVDTKPDSIENQNSEFIFHYVDIGETAYSIARSYGLKVKYLKNANKELNLQQLGVGEIVKIPKNKLKLIEKTAGTYDDKFYYLKVERKQTLFSLAKKYKITIEDISKANPELKNRMLIAGETIRIPILNDYIFTKLNRKNDSLLTVKTEDDFIEKASLDSATYPCLNFDYKQKKTPFNIGLFLPFYCNINDTLGNYDNKNNVYVYNRSRIFIEFYQGVLLAVEELKREHINVNLFVYDTQNDTLATKELIEKNEFKYFDLIIGPVYAHNLDIVAREAKKYKINIVSPLSINSDFLKNNFFAFQVNPSMSIKTKYWLNSVMKDSLQNVIIIHDGTNFERELTGNFKKMYLKKFADNIDNEKIHFQELLYFNSEDTIVKETMIKGMKNIVLIPSANRAFVTDIMAKLNTLTKEFDIKLYGMDKWVTFSNIPLDYFHNLNTHIYTYSFIDYNKYEVNEFVDNYRKVYKAEPGKFSFQAYDITLYFLQALQLYGKEFRFCINDFNPDLLETNFSFKRIDRASGFCNNSVFTIVYNHDYTRSLKK